MIDRFKEIDEKLKIALTPARYYHTLGVAYTAAAIAMKYDYAIERAFLAGLLHDCAKCVNQEDILLISRQHNIDISQYERAHPDMLHAKLGVVYAKKIYNIHDEAVLNAIKYHTTGTEDMTLLEKIIFIADFIEPNRSADIATSKLRMMAFDNIDLTMYTILKETMAYLNTKFGEDIEENTAMAYKHYQKLCERNGYI